MKNKIVFLISFLFLLIIPFSYGSCIGIQYPIDLNLNLEAIDTNHKISRFQFNEGFREGDILSIKDFTIYNRGNCTVSDPKVEIVLMNDKSEPQGKFCLWKLNTTINPHQSYKLSKISEWNYRDTDNKEVILCGHVLENEGKWEIRTDIDNLGLSSEGSKVKYTSFTAGSQTINGITLGGNVGFRVFTSTDLEIRELTKKTNNIAILAILIAIAGILVPICRDYIKNKKKQRELMLALLTEIGQVAKASESYKEIFLNNITSNVDYLKGNLKKKLKPFERYLKTKNKNLKELLKTDKTISKSIKLFSEELLKNYPSLYSRKKLPRFQIPSKIRQINSNFYLKSLDYKIKDEYNKETLINLLINLTERIELINSNVEFINNNSLILLDKNFSINPWFGNFYKIFWSLEDLDNQINIILEELLKNKYVKNYFNKNSNINNIKILYTIKQRFRI